MRLLWLTSLLPFPLDTGGKQVTFHWVRRLAQRGHRLTLVSCREEGELPPQALPGVELASPPRSGQGHRKQRLAIRGLFAGQPLALAKYWDPRRAAWLEKLLHERTFDVVHLDHLHMSSYGLQLQEVSPGPIVLTLHNVESALWSQAAEAFRHPLRRALLRSQARKLRETERVALTRFDLIHTLSPLDAQQLRARLPTAQVIAIPPGVELGPCVPEREEAGRVVFVGTMAWWPNAAGLRWLCRAVWPIVRRRLPEARLDVVGGELPGRLARSAPPGVHVCGRVPDVGPYLARAQVVVVPLLHGSGVRIKLLEALAWGKAVVSTPLGAQGLEVESGEHLWIEEDAEAFAERVIALLRDPTERQRLGRQGRALVRARYRWERGAAALEQAYQRLLETRSR